MNFTICKCKSKVVAAYHFVWHNNTVNRSYSGINVIVDKSKSQLHSVADNYSLFLELFKFQIKCLCFQTGL